MQRYKRARSAVVIPAWVAALLFGSSLFAEPVRVGSHLLHPVRSVVVDEEGRPVVNALVVAVWPAKRYDSSYHGSGYRDIGPLAFGEALTDSNGRFEIAPLANAGALLPRTVSRLAPVIVVYSRDHAVQRFENTKDYKPYQPGWPAEKSTVWRLGHEIVSEWNDRQIVLVADADAAHGRRFLLKQYGLAAASALAFIDPGDDALRPECVTEQLPYFTGLMKVLAMKEKDSASRFGDVESTWFNLPRGCSDPWTVLSGLEGVERFVDTRGLNLRPPFRWEEMQGQAVLVVARAGEDYSPPAPCSCTIRVRSEAAARGLMMLATLHGEPRGGGVIGADGFLSETLRVGKGERLSVHVVGMMAPPPPQLERVEPNAGR